MRAPAALAFLAWLGPSVQFESVSGKHRRVGDHRTPRVLVSPPLREGGTVTLSPEQTRQVESHFKGEGMHWRPDAMSHSVPTGSVMALDAANPVHKIHPTPAHRPWHAGGGGFEGVGSPGPGTRAGQKHVGGVADKIGTDPALYPSHMNQ